MGARFGVVVAHTYGSTSLSNVAPKESFGSVFSAVQTWNLGTRSEFFAVLRSSSLTFDH